MILSDFILIRDNPLQRLILQGLYNVNCVNCVYHVLSVIDTIPFKFGIKIGVRKKAAFRVAHAIIVQFLVVHFFLFRVRQNMTVEVHFHRKATVSKNGF